MFPFEFSRKTDNIIYFDLLRIEGIYVEYKDILKFKFFFIHKVNDIEILWGFTII